MPADKNKTKFARLNEQNLVNHETLTSEGYVDRKLEVVAYTSERTNTDTGEVKTSDRVEIVLTTKKWVDELKKYFPVPFKLSLTKEEFKEIGTLFAKEAK